MSAVHQKSMDYSIPTIFSIVLLRKPVKKIRPIATIFISQIFEYGQILFDSGDVKVVDSLPHCTLFSRRLGLTEQLSNTRI